MLGSTVTENHDRPQLVATIDMLENGLGGLHEVISLLEKRLDTVLEKQPAQGMTSPGPAAAPTMLADRVGSVHNGVPAAATRINDILGRLHV